MPAEILFCVVGGSVILLILYHGLRHGFEPQIIVGGVYIGGRLISQPVPVYHHGRLIASSQPRRSVITINVAEGASVTIR